MDESARLLGRYALYGEIATGGMATIHFGRLHGDSGFSRTVAIKRLHKQFARDPEFVSMFLDEARLAALIRHPNVVPTLDVVSTEGELFVVMEYVHGESLSTLIKGETAKKQRIPPQVVGAILSGTLQGLHAAHEARDERGEPLSIVHRDVSPHNVLVGVDGAARVLDFGIAKAAGSLHTTRQGEIKGKLPYMAPEQLMGEPATRLADVYAASVCLWEALTGRRLFSGTSEADVLNKVLLDDVPPPSCYAPELSKAVDEVVLRGLSRDPRDRFPSALQMAVALERAFGRIATTHQVSQWMDRIAGPQLQERHQKVQAIEQQGNRASEGQASQRTPSHGTVIADEPSLSAATRGIPVSEREPADPSDPWLTLVSRRQRLKRNLLFVLVAVLVPVLIIVGITAWGGPTRPAAAPASAPPRPALPSAETVAAPASASTDAVLEFPATSSTLAPSAAKAPSVPPSKATCSPPYYFDSAGRKRYKRECF
ncbi:serine/threonine protein kinase [Pendulispora brunnea]|uniref:Serine/threonine protein kinase n=1 Tax=Pendulispora brunnea TaxID=2905690 RepID=A0ABZ2KG81_9BACT